MAADSLDELMENPVEFIGALDSKAEESRHGGDSAGIKGAAERRTQINQMGGVRRLISMLDGSNLTGGSPKKGWVPPKAVTGLSISPQAGGLPLRAVAGLGKAAPHHAVHLLGRSSRRTGARPRGPRPGDGHHRVERPRLGP